MIWFDEFLGFMGGFFVVFFLGLIGFLWFSMEEVFGWLPIYVKSILSLM